MNKVIALILLTNWVFIAPSNALNYSKDLDYRGSVDFSANFQNGTLPNNWITFNVDGLTPHADVSQFTTAWIVEQDPQNSLEFAAQSTSRYDPPGQADDWLITPLIHVNDFPNLVWSARSGNASNRDGYEVYISTSTQDVNGCSMSSPVFTIAEENSSYTIHRINLYALGYNNQDIYVCFRNNSIDKHTLLLSWLQLQNKAERDVSILWVTASAEYQQFPALLGPLSLPLFFSVANNGYNTNIDLRATIEILKEGETIDVLTQDIIQPFSNTNITININFEDYIISELGRYDIKHSISILNNPDENQSDNFIPQYQLAEITEFTLARDDGTPFDSFGTNDGNGAQIGQEFTIENSGFIAGAEFSYSNEDCDAQTNICTLDGLTFSIDILEIDPNTNKPNNIIASSQSYTIPPGQSSNTISTLNFQNKPIALTPGTFVLVVNEPLNANAQITTTQGYSALKTWVNWPSNPEQDWVNNRDLGFNQVYYLRALFVEEIIYQDGFE